MFGWPNQPYPFSEAKPPDTTYYLPHGQKRRAVDDGDDDMEVSNYTHTADTPPNTHLEASSSSHTAKRTRIADTGDRPSDAAEAAGSVQSQSPPASPSKKRGHDFLQPPPGYAGPKIVDMDSGEALEQLTYKSDRYKSRRMERDGQPSPSSPSVSHNSYEQPIISHADRETTWYAPDADHDLDMDVDGYIDVRGTALHTDNDNGDTEPSMDAEARNRAKSKLGWLLRQNNGPARLNFNDDVGARFRWPDERIYGFVRPKSNDDKEDRPDGDAEADPAAGTLVLYTPRPQFNIKDLDDISDGVSGMEID